MKKFFTPFFLLGLVAVNAVSQNISVNTDGTSGPGLFNVGNTATPPFQVLSTGQLLGKPDGSITVPSYSFVGNTGTGMFQPATNTIAFSTNSLERMRLGNTGILTLNYLAGTGNRLLVTNATGDLSALANGTSGQVLSYNGTGYSWVTPASGSVTSVGLSMPTGFTVSNSPVTGSGTLTVSTTLNGPIRGNGSGFTTGNTNLASEVTGVLPIANGGTNTTATPTNGGMAYGTGTAYAFTAAGTSGYMLQSNGAAAPTWVDAGGLFIKNQTSQQASSNFNVSGSGVVGTTMQAGTYLFPAPTGDPSPVITARTVPTGQGNANERTELILFHSNDGANGSGEDLITLRAPALRFQTYTDASVTDVNNNAGSNDRMYINPAGQVSVNNLAGTGARLVYADANGTLTTGSNNSANNNWSISANFAFSPDDLGTTSIFADNTDDARYVHTLPFSVTIEGVAYTQITICSNGWVAFGDVNSTTFNATALPATFTNNPVIFPFWTDLKDYGSGEYVVVRNEGTSPNRTVVVYFRMRALWATSAVAEFQLQIHEGSALLNVKYISMAPTLNGQQWTGDATKSTAIGFQLGGGASAKAYPITFNGKVLDDNRSDREGWSVCPVR